MEFSRLGIGFEKLDRAVFDPEKAYDPVAASGVKWVRIPSSRQRTKTEMASAIFGSPARAGLRRFLRNGIRIHHLNPNGAVSPVSNARSLRLFSRPEPKPPVPCAATTRWQGVMIKQGLA